MSTDGTECDSGKSDWPAPTLDEDNIGASVLSRPETQASPLAAYSNLNRLITYSFFQLCDDCKLSSRDYVLLKAALLKEQATKLQGLPLRANVGGGSNTDDVQELKRVVKDFMKTRGWLPYFS
jgi:hypothetical protein